MLFTADIPFPLVFYHMNVHCGVLPIMALSRVGSSPFIFIQLHLGPPSTVDSQASQQSNSRTERAFGSFTEGLAARIWSIFRFCLESGKKLSNTCLSSTVSAQVLESSASPGMSCCIRGSMVRGVEWSCLGSQVPKAALWMLDGASSRLGLQPWVVWLWKPRPKVRTGSERILPNVHQELRFPGKAAEVGRFGHPLARGEENWNTHIVLHSQAS